jgi:proline dehydrogenase
MMRAVLLAASRNAWLREHACRWGFVRRSVSRFMPGERIEDALEAARRLRAEGITSILTCLGENVGTMPEADTVAAHYLDAIERVERAGLDAPMSVKLTQLGLDLSMDACVANLVRLARRAGEHGARVWIDMESSPYVERTLTAFVRARLDAPNLGVCLQAYLRRTPADLEELLPLAPAIRLVKGAYQEPAGVAFPKKTDVDEQYLRLAIRALEEAGRRPGTFLGLGTHDVGLLDRILAHPARAAAPAGSWEIEMLYGIRAGEQRRLAAAGLPVRVLISYGPSWFPWYMRRLAERPANVWFVLRNLFR